MVKSFHDKKKKFLELSEVEETLYFFLLQRNVLRLRLIFGSHCAYSSFKTKFDVEKQIL